MSNLGFQTIYAWFNAQADVVCERAFWDPPPRGRAAYQHLSLESQRELGEFAALAFSIAFELDYFHVVATLKAAGIPPLAKERDERHPVIIAGGPAIFANPEPLAPFFDALVIGEAEPVLPLLLEALRQGMDGPRQALWRRLAAVPGVYTPGLYEPLYDHQGRYQGLATEPGAPATVARAWWKDLESWPTHTAILTPDTELSDMYLIEIARGCGRWCRFCLAGYGFLPARWRRADTVLKQAQEGLKLTPHIGLVSAAASDHPQIDEIAQALRALGARLSVSSLRVAPLSETLVRCLAESGNRSIALGIEAGSERLRDYIGKGVHEGDIARAVDLLARYGVPQVKLYFMIGLPTEEEADIDALIELSQWVRGRLDRRRPATQVIVTISPYVPKAQTPFQWAAMAEPEVLKERLARIRGSLCRRGVRVRSDSVGWARIEGLLARGDRRLAQVLLSLKENSLRGWDRALERAGIDGDAYLRPRNPAEPLPWDIVSTGVRRAFLERELRRAEAQKVSPPCTHDPRCARCGVCAPATTAAPLPLLVR